MTRSTTLTKEQVANDEHMVFSPERFQWIWNGDGSLTLVHYTEKETYVHRIKVCIHCCEVIEEGREYVVGEHGVGIYFAHDECEKMSQSIVENAQREAAAI